MFLCMNFSEILKGFHLQSSDVDSASSQIVSRLSFSSQLVFSTVSPMFIVSLDIILMKDSLIRMKISSFRFAVVPV